MGKCSALGNENEIVLRTAEFFMARRHTAHATKAEAVEESEK
jgi:prolyl-tRNA synthetase